MAFAEPLAGEELERTLARYARLRLDPSPGQARHARAAVMEAAWRRHLDPHPIELARTPVPAAAHHARVPFSGWGMRRFGASFAAGEAAPMTVALNNLVSTSTGVKEYNVDMAAAVIAALPTLLVYVVAGRYFVRGLMAGAVKG